MDNDKVKDLRSWLGLKEPFSFDRAKPLGPMLSVLIIILFSLAILTAFKLLGSALFGTTPKGTASSFGLSGMIVAMIGAPLVVWRTSIAQDQTKTAKEALFNDKVNAAVTDLHAQRQITKWKDDKAENGWDDDVTRRNGAIDRLLGLATEDPQSASRIARMLSVYVKELSRAIQPEAIPDTSSPKEIRDWALSLKASRSDVENAVQVLGKLRQASGQRLDQGEIDLSETNLQGFQLSFLNFSGVSFRKAHLQGADLSDIKLDGADLSFVRLEGADLRRANLKTTILTFAQMHAADLFCAMMQGADLWRAQMQGTDLRFSEFDAKSSLNEVFLDGAGMSYVDLSLTKLTDPQLLSIFGDATVTLANNIESENRNRPKHWSKENLSVEKFVSEWHRFQASINQEPAFP